MISAVKRLIIEFEIQKINKTGVKYFNVNEVMLHIQFCNEEELLL